VEPRQANLNEGPKEKNRDNFSSTIQENPTIKYHMKKPCISVNYPWLKITSHKFKSTGAVKVTMEVKMTKILIRHHLCLVNCPWSEITPHKFMSTGAVKVTMKVKMTEILNRYHLCLIQVPNNSIYETSKMEIFSKTSLCHTSSSTKQRSKSSAESARSMVPASTSPTQFPRLQYPTKPAK
jgi:hypothetical protein